MLPLSALQSVVQRQGSLFKLVGPCLLAAKFLGPLVRGKVLFGDGVFRRFERDGQQPTWLSWPALLPCIVAPQPRCHSRQRWKLCSLTCVCIALQIIGIVTYVATPDGEQ